jgi:hypothetical protein
MKDVIRYSEAFKLRLAELRPRLTELKPRLMSRGRNDLSRERNEFIPGAEAYR